MIGTITPKKSWRSVAPSSRAASRSSAPTPVMAADRTTIANPVWSQTRITISAERYDATEQANVSLATASHDPSAIIVESGGNNVPVDPGYGKNWTPQQREAYARTQRLININDGGEVWNGTFPISAAAGFQQANAAAYTWPEVQSLLAGTDPGAISAAGTAYGQLAGKLTEVASKVASLGNSLAGSWGGSTAVTAVSQVQQLYQTASDMQANAWQAQNALT